jgi:ketosteroid isomerase-like protein
MIGALVARKALAGAFDALNRHELAEFMSAWRDDGVFVYPGDIPESGTFQGRNAVEGWFSRFFEQFPTIQFDIQDICVRNPSTFWERTWSPSIGTSGWSTEREGKGGTVA